MSNPSDLLIGQYQIGELPMGILTPFAIEDYSVGYDVNAQDYQIPSSSEIQFGEDTRKASPLQFKINCLVNKWLPNMLAITGQTPEGNPPMSDTGIEDFKREWEAEDVISQWGATKPLYFRPEDGVLRKFYGRPGKMAYTINKISGQMCYQITAEYRRLDTYAYSDTEHTVEFEPDTPQVLIFPGNFGPAWVRITFDGAAVQPTVNINEIQLKLGLDIPIGRTVEISSYPWARRVVNDLGQNLGPYLEGDRPYLGRLKMPFDQPVVISASSHMRFHWHDSYRVL